MTLALLGTFGDRLEPAVALGGVFLVIAAVTSVEGPQPVPAADPTEVAP